MTDYELAKYNVGENIDSLMNLDPRGYGVCRILYAGARKYAGAPLAMHAAEKMYSLLAKKTTGDETTYSSQSNFSATQVYVDSSKNTVVAVMSGFILRPHLQPETDGIVGALLLVRALVKAFNITPFLLVTEKNIPAVKACVPLLGLHAYENIETAKKMPYSFAYTSIPVSPLAANAKIKMLLNKVHPALLFSTETAGANEEGQYHNAVGVNMTDIEAKQDSLFTGWQLQGVPTFAVGDLGNEMGMGTLADFITKFIPYAGDGSHKGGKDDCSTGCKCGCKHGIVAATKAEYVITATVSDWGVYGVIAALAFLCKNIDIMHDEKIEDDVLRECSRCGMVDMTGALVPSIDGFDVEIEKEIVALMRSTVSYALNYSSPAWFAAVHGKGFYEQL